jgi:hypothetical protein
MKDTNNLVFSCPLEIDLWQPPAKTLAELYVRAIGEHATTTANLERIAEPTTQPADKPSVSTEGGSPDTWQLMTL